MFRPYLGAFKQQVFILGPDELSRYTIEKLQENNPELYLKSLTIKVINDLNTNYKPMSQAQNQQGDEGGILKAYWISKILEHIPSCLVLLYDWTKPELSQEKWNQKISQLSSEYDKYKDLLLKPKVKVMVIIYLGKNLIL